MAWRLFLFLLVAVLIASCTARSLPASVQAKNISASPAFCVDNHHVYDLFENCPGFKGVDWRGCMKSILQRYLKECNNQCNVIIYKLQDIHSHPTPDEDYKYVLSPNTTKPKCAVFDYVTVVHIPRHKYLYHVTGFHGNATYETIGWHGWFNWAFAGKFNHDDSNKVVFFDN